MDERRPEFLIERYSAEQVKELLDDLLRCHKNPSEGKRLLDQWDAYNPPPVPPERFAGMRALVDYSHAKREYEQQRERMVRQRETFEKDCQGKEHAVAEILYEGIPIVHSYRGQTYEIVRVSAKEPEDPSRVRRLTVSIRKLN